MKHVETTSRMLAGSCFLGGKVADEFHEVLLGNLGNPQAPLLPLAVSLAMQVGSWKQPSGRQSICYILLPFSLDNEEYIKYDHWATALHSNQAPSSGVASRRVSIRAPQRNPEDPDHTKHVPTISYCVVPKLCKSPTFFLSLSQRLLP